MAVLSILQHPGLVMAWALAAAVLYVLAQALYNLFLHPLRRFPGPRWSAISRIPYFSRLMGGTLPFDMLDLHNKYGPIVRIAPDELAFSQPEAWKDIMGHRSGGATSAQSVSGEEMGKYQKFYSITDHEPPNIVNADREEHSRLRRQLAHGFSDKAMRDQEPLISQYIDLLIKRLHENASATKPVDIMAWYNYTTFDVIGDLAFGEPFGCLNSSEYHPWVKMIFESARAGTVLQAAGYIPMLKKLLFALVPKSIIEKHEQNVHLAKAKVQRRMEMGQDRPDLIEGLLKRKDEWGLSVEKIVSNSNILIIGGSETTATLLSGATYFLLMNPHTLERVVKEVRDTFQTEDEITINSVSGLTYMLACLNEALRSYPPVPIGLPRQVPKGGANIAGHFIPEDTVVAIHQWAAYHNESNFADPFGFHPERFLDDDKRFANDKRDVFQPFSLGPRNCLGRNLAYAEMRLILTRVLFHFDMRITDESRNWADQKIYFLWKKGPLNVYLTPRAGAGKL